MIPEPVVVFQDNTMKIIAFTEGMFLFTPDGIARPGRFASSKAAKLANELTDEQIIEHLGPIYRDHGRAVLANDVHEVFDYLEYVNDRGVR